MRINGGGRGRYFFTQAGEKIRHERFPKAALGSQSGVGERPHAMRPGLWSWGGVEYYDVTKKRPSCTDPLGSYMYEVGWGKSIFFWFPLVILARRGDSGRPRGCPKGLGGRHPDLGGSPVEIP